MEDQQQSEGEELLVATDAATTLRAAREAKRLDLEHISAETRIPLRHLESIEAGRFDALPSRTYALGFSRTYARQVGLDEDEIADLVRAEMAETDYYPSSASGGMEPGDPAKLPSAGLAWFGAFAALLLAVGAIAFFSTRFGAGAGPESLLVDEDTVEGTADGVSADAGSSNASAGPAPDPSGQVVLTAVEDVWVRISEEDGERLFEGTMASGDTFEVPKTASEPRINTGRPDLIEVTIDGKPVPKLADEPAQLGNEPVSAAALLARADAPNGSEAATN